MKRQIPNIITLCNLTCGVIAIIHAVEGHLDLAALWMLLGIAFDFCDGLAARLLHVASPLGKELDSLADVVTSGVVPGIILLSVFNDAIDGIEPRYAVCSYIALLVPAFSAYRLAKFNLDTRQSHSFLGLPVPSNAIVWAAIGACFCNSSLCEFAIIPTTGIVDFLTDNYIGLFILLAIELSGCVLMVSEVPLFALKFKSLGWKENKTRYIFLLGAMLLIMLFGVLGLAFTIAWYIILSLLSRKTSQND